MSPGPGRPSRFPTARGVSQARQETPAAWDDDRTADRNYIKEFILGRNRELGKRYGVEYAEVFHYIGPSRSRVDDYVRQNAIPLK